MQPGEGRPSPEFELVLASVRWPLEPANAARIRELAQGPLSWPHLLKIAHHHQVTSLVARNLESCAADCVPPEPRSSLRLAAVENARLCFQAISELSHLHRLFREQGIDLLVLKGAPLAVYAFQDATLRGAGDLDLLVRPADLPRADAILRSQGYLRCEPEPWRTPRRMRSYLAHQKDFSYTHARTGGALDLHWRLFRNRWLPFNSGLEDAGSAWVQIGPERFATLPFDHLLLYLCVHGALDGWLRLKWLADIAALLRESSKEQLRSAAQAAIACQTLPEFSAAILLCRQKLGFDAVPAECLSSQAPSVARILRFANRLMESNDYCPERERISSTAWFLNELFLHRSLRYRAELLERSLFRRRVWQRVSLPDVLFPLYAVLSPAEWLLFRAERLSRWLLDRVQRPQAAGDGNPRAPIFPRLLGLSPRDLALLAEAGLLLAFFRAALKFFPVQRVTGWMGKGERGRSEPSSPPCRVGPVEGAQVIQTAQAIQTIQRVEWALGALVRHAPLTFVCFPQSFAAYFMLRRRHIPSKLFYGVAREKQQLKAHTWIKVGDRTVVGGEVESEFTVLAIFP